MLLGFSTENFRAFRDAEELSMRRVGVESRPVDDGWDPGVSTLAAVYGANASGKSTLVDAIRFAVGAVRDSFTRWPPGGGTPVTPFRLSKEVVVRPTRFEFQVRARDGLEYHYWFELDRSRVRREELWVYRTARRSLLFAREGDDLRTGDSFRGQASPVREVIAGRSEALVLSVMDQFAVPAVQAVHEAIVGIDTYAASHYRAGEGLVVHTLRAHGESLDDVVAFIRRADLGITDVRLVRQAPEVLATLREQLNSFGFEDDVVERMVDESADRPQLLHQGEDGAVSIPFDLESQGTVAILAFAPVVLAALRTGGVVVIDEIDTSLHPDVVRELVAIFASPESNPRQAQLLMTTHDASLLAPTSGAERVVERDQVWITEKDPQTGVATLTPVSDYSPRKDENLQRGYLTGRYGGIPDLALRDFVAAELAGAGAAAGE